MLNLLLLSGALLLQNVPAEKSQSAPADKVAAEPDTPLMTAAKANLPLAKTRPVQKGTVDDSVPESAKAQGAHGKVTLTGVMGTDGRLTELRVTTSSKSDELDAAALAAAAAAEFEPTRDAQGNPLVYPGRIPFKFDSALDSGAPGYRCGQMVRDTDWWVAHWPGEDDDFRKMFTGFAIAGSVSRGQEAIRQAIADFDRRWEAAIAACRKAPDRKFLELFNKQR
ncbi:TonB family protein [Sphingomonas sp. R-74633]|uniref:TonB family protein n=1 Tax=Sphingomonas sp. R-74633 TaxID=2751188 RepID=UPI0015D25A01|nr:TonB family protein [Sphingomonas sp. R-74633]NYT41836.1 TonB family protein [Sphingomonas sp. R-74633]